MESKDNSHGNTDRPTVDCPEEESHAREIVDRAYQNYEAIKHSEGAGSIEGHRAYTVWSDALDDYNRIKKLTGKSYQP